MAKLPMTDVLRLFGTRLRALRSERGLRVIDVAHALSCDPSSIYGIESARHAISFRSMVELARLLRVDELDLFTFPDLTPRDDLIDLTRRASPRIVLATRAHLLAKLRDLGRRHQP